MVGLYDKTITICNKLKKADIPGATVDQWIKTVLTECCEIKEVPIKNVVGNTVSMGKTITVLIPFGKGYLPYNTWKSDTTKGYTMTQGDTLFLNMELTENPTNATITSLKNLYPTCDVRIIQIIEQNGMATVEVKVEGV